MIRKASALGMLFAMTVGCGARTGLLERKQQDAGSDAEPDVEEVLPECDVDRPCPGSEDLCRQVVCRLPEGICVPQPEVLCDDQDPCTGDRCVSETGQCLFEPLSFDLDGDDFNGPRPGFAPGEPGACGDDCDDSSPLAFPGGQEVCDGVDNDCNGIVDDGALFAPAEGAEVLVSASHAPAQPTGLGWSGDSGAGYLAAYGGTEDAKSRVFLQRLSVDGQLVDPPQQLTMVNADADGGFLVWTGDRYGVAWMDRRFQDYEIFFNLTDAYGTKLIPDVRLSNGYGFSIYPTMVFDGTHFVVAWQDDRDGLFSVWGQRVRVDGTLVGQEKTLVGDVGRPLEAPFLAKGDHNVGMVWLAGGTFDRQIQFWTFDQEMQPQGLRVDLTAAGEGGVYPMLVWNRDAYVAAWYDSASAPFTIYGAVVDEKGTILVPATPLAVTPSRARYPWLMPLGDRLLLLFSDDRDGNAGYELYAKMVTANLEAASPDIRITKAEGHSIYPMASFGPAGDLGVLFRDDRLLEQHVYFTRLSCVLPE